MKRKKNWQTKLHAAVLERKRTPFEWGSHDCCKAAADVVKAITGHDLMKGLCRYRSAAGAGRILKRAGYTSLSDAITDRALKAGFLQQAVAMSRRGDLVLMDWPEIDGTAFGSVPGICVGTTAIFASEIGWIHAPLINATHSFKVAL